MPKRLILSAGKWCGLAAAVVLVATLAVPWVQRGVGGAAVRADVLLTATYPTEPVPGVLFDLESLVDLRPKEQTAEFSHSCLGCQMAGVMELKDQSGLVVLPQRAAFWEVAVTNVLVVMLNPDGTERWRIADDRFDEVKYQQCLPGPEVLTCLLTTAADDLTILRLRATDGEILAETDLPDTITAGWTAIDLAEADLMLLRDKSLLVRYDLDTGQEKWSLDVGPWSTGPVMDAWAEPDDGRLIVGANFGDYSSGPDSVWALVDPDSGELRWRTTDWLNAEGGKLYEIAFEGDHISRLDEVGLPVWSVEGVHHQGWFHGDPLVVADDRLQRLDGETGHVLWSAAWPGTDNWVRPDSSAGVVTTLDESAASSIVLDGETGLVRDRFDGALVAEDRERRYVRFGEWGEEQLLRGTDRHGTTLWELSAADLIPGDQASFGVIAGRLSVQSSTHLLLLEPS